MKEEFLEGCNFNKYILDGNQLKNKIVSNQNTGIKIFTLKKLSVIQIACFQMIKHWSLI